MHDYPGKRPQTVWGCKRILQDWWWWWWWGGGGGWWRWWWWWWWWYDEVDVEDEEEDDDVDEDDVENTLCASLRSRNAGQEPFLWKFTGEMPDPNTPTHVFVRACAVEAHMDIWEEPISCGNLKEKCRTLIARQAFCASLRNRNAHGHFTRAILSGNLEGQCRTPRLPPRLNIGP